MALHGSIEANHHLIGSWSARRIETHPSGRHLYRWQVEVHGGVEYTGELWHDHDRGALALARAVMSAAVLREGCAS